MAVTDWSTSPAANTAISGYDISTGCPAGNLNNAIQVVMADVRGMYDALPSTTTLMPKAGGTFSGAQPIYTGRGAFLHHNSASHSSGRIFVQASGGATPAGMASGDLLLEY